MATMTVSLPDPMKEWIEKQIDNGDYASTSDYVRDLVRRDRARRDEQLTMEELRQLVAESRKSGIGQRSVDDIFHEAARIAKARGVISE
jgi:antitoxin ParD1/3/4